MAETIVRRYCGVTMHREVNTCVIELQTSWRQSASCELNPLLTLRGFTRSEPKVHFVVTSNPRHKV